MTRSPPSRVMGPADVSKLQPGGFSIEIGSCVLNNVEAMLVGRPMPEPLLGKSALLRMSIEMSNGKMSLSCPVDPARPAVALGSGAKPREPSRQP